jgi:hypothetical protein
MLNENNGWGVTCSVRQLIVCKLYRSIGKFTKWGVNPWVEFKQKFQLDSTTSRYRNQLAPQIFY